MTTPSGSSSSSALLALLLLVGCDGSGPELTFQVTGAASCAITCQVTGVDIYVLKQQGTTWCVMSQKSFVPTGERAIDGLDLEAGTTIRLVILGYCGQDCTCRFDDKVVVDPQAGSLSLPLQRDAFCEALAYDPC